MALPVSLAEIPWSFVMAFASLAVIYYLFRRRSDVFADFAFSGKEVALLALGSVAGWAVNVPVAVFGGTYLTVNVGGTIVPIILIALWIKQGKLSVIPATIGTALVAIAAWKIVSFHPETGIVAAYPTFFLPVVVALVFALVVSFRKPIKGVPIAYATGTLGALIGADLLHVSDIRRYFSTAPENTVISIGGAGVFDMVFLAGTFAMALHLCLVVVLRRKTPKLAPRRRPYPSEPLSLRDSRKVAASFRAIESPNPLERAIQGLALSNIALREGEHTRSVRMAWLAVDSLLREPGASTLPPAAHADLAQLRAQYLTLKERDATLAEAGNANLAAKHLVAEIAPRTGLRHTLEGVA